jgi:hypothetical protein
MATKTHAHIDQVVLTSESSYIVAKPGDNLISKYGQAKLLNASANNRVSLIIFPGTYSLDSELQIDSEYIDIIGIGAQVQSPAVFITTNTLNVSANNVMVSGISVGSLAFKAASNKPLQKFENCVGGNGSFAGIFGDGSTIAAGTYINCVGGAGSFGGSWNGGSAIGIFKNCSGGAYSFGSGGTANGTFIDCVAGDWSFGLILSSGLYINCSAGNYCFAYGGDAAGSYINCSAGNAFGGQGGIASGVFKGCSAGYYSFGGFTDGKASGKFIDCTANHSSFGSAGGSATGQFINCQMYGGSLPTLSRPAADKLPALMINCIDTNGDVVNGRAEPLSP